MIGTIKEYCTAETIQFLAVHYTPKRLDSLDVRKLDNATFKK